MNRPSTYYKWQQSYMKEIGDYKPMELLRESWRLLGPAERPPLQDRERMQWKLSMCEHTLNLMLTAYEKLVQRERDGITYKSGYSNGHAAGLGEGVASKVEMHNNEITLLKEDMLLQFGDFMWHCSEAEEGDERDLSLGYDKEGNPNNVTLEIFGRTHSGFTYIPKK